MVNLKPLLGMMLKASIRRFFAAGSRSRDGGSVLIALLFLSQGPRFLKMCDQAAMRLSLGETTQAISVLSLLFLSWVAVPLLLRSGGLDCDSIVRLRRLPMTPFQVFLMSAMELFFNPLLWFLMMGNIVAFRFCAQAPDSLAAYVGFVLFCVTCLSGMLCMAHFLLVAGRNYRSARQLIFLVVGCAALGLWQPQVAISLLPPTRWITITVEPTFLQYTFLIAVAALFMALATLSFLWLLRELHRDTGEHRPPARAGRWRIPLLPGPYGHLLRWSLRQRLKSFSTVFSWVISLGICIAFGWAGTPEPEAFWVALGAIGMGSLSLWGNLFGVEGEGVTRLQLWPLSGWQVIALCHLATLPVVLVPMIPVVVLCALRLDVVMSFAACFFLLAQLLFLAILGLNSSLDDPAPKLPLGDQRSAQTKLSHFVVNGMMSLAMIVAAVSAQREGVVICLLLMVGITLLGAGLYFWRMRVGGQKFEDNAALFADRLGTISDG